MVDVLWWVVVGFGLGLATAHVLRYEPRHRAPSRRRNLATLALAVAVAAGAAYLERKDPRP